MGATAAAAAGAAAAGSSSTTTTISQLVANLGVVVRKVLLMQYPYLFEVM